MCHKEKCPAYGKSCAKCGRLDHFAVKCLSGESHNRKDRVHTEEDLSEENADNGDKTVDYLMAVSDGQR